MNISNFFIDRPRFAMVIAVLITLCGGIAIFTLPIELFPQAITPPQVSIKASYPGASAETVKETVVEPVEEQVNGVKHMLYMASTASNDGTARFNITFEIGSDNDINTVNVKNRMSLAEPRLPDSVRKSGLEVKEKSTNMLCIMHLYSPNHTYDSSFLRNYGKIHINDELARIPGVGDVMTFGDSYSMRVWLDPDRLASLNLSVQEVLDAIAEQNVQVTAGDVGGAPVSDKQRIQYTLQTKGRLGSVKDFEDIVVRSSKSSNVLLKDVARIDLGSASYSIEPKFNNQNCASIGVYQLPGANAVETVSKIHKTMDKLSKRFPKDLNYDITYQCTDFISASIQELAETLLIAVGLVILVVYIFLQDWRATMIPSIAVPVSLIGAFAAMKAMGFSINILTLFGLILAIGIVVDDAIIVVENVYRLMHDEALSPKAAAKKTMQQVSGPIVSTTMVLLSVFVPVSFLPGISGELYRQFALTISFSVAISALNALTLSPALCSVFLPKSEKKRAGFFGLFNIGFLWLTRRYGNCAAFFVRKLALSMLAFLLLGCCCFFLYGRLPKTFIPEEDKGFFMIDVQLPDNASLPRTMELTSQLSDSLRKLDGVKAVAAVNGISIMTLAPASNSAFLVVALKNWDLRKDPALFEKALVAKVSGMTASIPDARITPFSLPSIPGLGTSGGFNFILQSTMTEDPRALAATLNSLIERANKQPELSHVFSSYRANVPQVYLDIDREKAKTLGVSCSDVFTLLEATMGTTYVNDFNKYGRVYQVRVQSDEKYRRMLSDIKSLYVQNSDGKLVPLDSLLIIKPMFGPQVIERYNMFTSARITGSAAPGHSSGEAIKLMEGLASSLPEGMAYEWTDMSYQELLAGSRVAVIFCLCVLFAYLFLVALYESWMLPLAVIFSVPLAFLGALVGLFIASQTNNIYTQIGFVLLVGLAAKTSILIVEFAMMEREDGKSIKDAALHAAKLRFRAICMTSLAFILGVLPLAIATGAGAASRRALGTAVFAGMIGAGLLATLIIPTFYVLVQSVREWSHRTRMNLEEKLEERRETRKEKSR